MDSQIGTDVYASKFNTSCFYSIRLHSIRIPPPPPPQKKKNFTPLPHQSPLTSVLPAIPTLGHLSGRKDVAPCSCLLPSIFGRLCFVFSHAFQTSFLEEHCSFLVTTASETCTCTNFAAKIGQAMVNLKLWLSESSSSR